MKHLSTIWESLLDIFFPGRPEEKQMRALTLKDLAAHRAIPGTLDGRGNYTIDILLSYASPLVRSCIHTLKYRHNTSIANLFGALLHDTYAAEIGDAYLFAQAPILLIPVPLSKERLRERGYNQVHEVARAWCRHNTERTLILADDLLIRHRNTPSQTQTKTREERLKNVRGCFTLTDRERIQGAHIILLDDVATTGATLHAARTAIAQGNPAHITLIALTH